MPTVSWTIYPQWADFLAFQWNRHRACHDADAGHCHQLYRHQLPARHPYPLTVGRKRRRRRADAHRHGGEFQCRDGWALTLFIATPSNGNSVWVRVVEEVSGAVFELEITADLPAYTEFLSPRLFLNNGSTAAAAAYNCSGCMWRQASGRSPAFALAARPPNPATPVRMIAHF